MKKNKATEESQSEASLILNIAIKILKNL